MPECIIPAADLTLGFLAIHSIFVSLYCSILRFPYIRSHHTSVALNDELLCFVGGWDGKKRTSDVWLFNITHNQWTLLTPHKDSDPPAGIVAHSEVI